jgi:hypothetical protein
MNRISAAILALGFASSLAVFLTAKAEDVDPMLGDPLTNKKYLYELKRIGGEANVLSAEFQEWFAAQWRGVLLARTIGVLTVGTTLVFRFIALEPAPDDPATVNQAPRETDPARTKKE